MEKKDFAKHYFGIIDLIAKQSYLNPNTLLNISFSQIKQNPKALKHNLFFPILMNKKVGIGAIPKKQLSIFDSYRTFAESLNILPDAVKMELKKSKSNPQKQLYILRQYGI